MTAVEIIARLEGVQERGARQWMACCPAHEDRSPSLSVRELGDGTTLLHCFAGCDVLTICRTIGIELRDLFLTGRIRRVEAHERPRLSASDALAALDHETHVVATIGADFLAHREIDRETWDRLTSAVVRISDARAACCPARVPDRE